MLENSTIAPQLNTDLTDPFHLLEKKFIQSQALICEWFNQEWQKTLPPVYGSVDLRNAGFKLAPIDMNLFPAGFNNLNPNFLSFAVEAAKKIILQLMPQAKNILIIPESHTRNKFYWSNVKILQSILNQAGFTSRIGSLAEELNFPFTIQLHDGSNLLLEKVNRVDNQLSLTDFVPEFILLNNDLSDGIPPILENLNQTVSPPIELGWSQRLKSEHFQSYANVAKDFATLLNIDPWLISPLSRHCGKVDFMQQEGLDCIISNAEILFAEIERKYAEYKIPQQPFLIVKADAGTYGMAVMTVRNIQELKNLNRKQRTRMASTKGGQPVHRVIIQEGVYTFETLGDNKAVAEPVVYLWGSDVIGGFYRVHKDRGNDENLNTPGMQFEPIAFSQTCHEPRADMAPGACQNRFYTYGIIAQLSMLAAAREIKDQMQK